MIRSMLLVSILLLLGGVIAAGGIDEKQKAAATTDDIREEAAEVPTYVVAWHDCDHIQIALSFQLAEARELYNRVDAVAKLLNEVDTDRIVDEYGLEFSLQLNRCRNVAMALGVWLQHRVRCRDHGVLIPVHITAISDSDQDFVVQAPSLSDCDYMVAWTKGLIWTMAIPTEDVALSLYHVLPANSTRIVMRKNLDLPVPYNGRYQPNLPSDLFRSECDRDIRMASGRPAIVQLLAAQIRQLFVFN